jgi:hypothetical protein
MFYTETKVPRRIGARMSIFIRLLLINETGKFRSPDELLHSSGNRITFQMLRRSVATDVNQHIALFSASHNRIQELDQNDLFCVY